MAIRTASELQMYRHILLKDPFSQLGGHAIAAPNIVTKYINIPALVVQSWVSTQKDSIQCLFNYLRHA